MRFSSLVDRISGAVSDAWSVHMDAVARKDAGRPVILLTVGNPDLPPPTPVIEATVDALRRHRTTYSAIAGLPKLRAAVAARHARRTGAACAPENVVMVAGAQTGLFAAMKCLAGPGDEVVVPEPMYATYAAVAGAAGATLVPVPLDPGRGFHPDIEALGRAVTPRTRVVWINSPHNPTGAVMTREEVEAVAALCRRHDLWLLSDEVYQELAFERPHVSPWSLPDMAGRTVVVSSLSKSHAIPGFRAGWVIGPEALSRHLADLLICMQYGGPPFIQEGALVALERDLPEPDAIRSAYRRRAALLAGILETAPGCRALMPEGGMFLLLDVRGTGLGSLGFAQALLDRHSVAVLPCDGFGAGLGGWLRISLGAADAEIETAGLRIRELARSCAPG
jgi:arginine:pyruvate transaminase